MTAGLQLTKDLSCVRSQAGGVSKADKVQTT